MNLLRYCQGLVASIACTRFSTHKEDIVHCMRDCPHLQEAWIRVSFDMDSHFFHLNLGNWLENFVKGVRNTLFLASFWRWESNKMKGFDH